MPTLPLSDDEWRLIHFFRCMSVPERSDSLRKIGAQAMSRCLGEDAGVLDFMPDAGGLQPEKNVGNFHEIRGRGFIVEILYDGIQETGEPSETLLGTSDFDEEEAIPRFAYGASKAADKQCSSFHYDLAFAREYIPAWRWEIVRACEEGAKKLATQAEADDESDS